MTELQIAAEHHAIVKGAEDTGGGWEGAGAGVQGRKGGGVDEVADKMDSLMEQALVSGTAPTRTLLSCIALHAYGHPSSVTHRPSSVILCSPSTVPCRPPFLQAHLTRRIDATKASTSASSRFWEDIWDVFEAALLPTHRSKFTQFFIFHALAAGPPEWRGRFLQGLVGLMMERSRPGVLRCACAAYLGSFLARATFLAESLVVEALEAVVLVSRAVQRRWRATGSGTSCANAWILQHSTACLGGLGA